MQQPQVTFHQENTAETQRQLDATAQSSFFKFDKDTITYLYILPPWSERGLLARMVKECWLGKDDGRHTCWHTYELFGQPELGKKDPIVNTVFEAYGARGKPADIKKMLPNMRWYVNAIVDGVSKLGPNGEETDNYEALVEPKQVIVGFTDAMWRELTKRRNAPGIGCIYDPSAAISVIVKRDDQTENGITKYSIDLAGSKVQGSFTPERTNLYERFEGHKPGGAQKVAEIVQNLNNLEERWPMPTQEAFVEAERKAAMLKSKLLGGAGTAAPGAGTDFGGAPVPGGFAPPGGAVGGFVPGQAPQGAPQQAAPGVAAGAPPGAAVQPQQPVQQPQQPAPGTVAAPGTPAGPPGGATAAPAAPAQPVAPAQPTTPAGPPGMSQGVPGAPAPTAPGTVGAAGGPPGAQGFRPPVAPPGA